METISYSIWYILGAPLVSTDMSLTAGRGIYSLLSSMQPHGSPVVELSQLDQNYRKWQARTGTAATALRRGDFGYTLRRRVQFSFTIPANPGAAYPPNPGAVNPGAAK